MSGIAAALRATQSMSHDAERAAQRPTAAALPRLKCQAGMQSEPTPQPTLHADESEKTEPACIWHARRSPNMPPTILHTMRDDPLLTKTLPCTFVVYTAGHCQN